MQTPSFPLLRSAMERNLISAMFQEEPRETLQEIP